MLVFMLCAFALLASCKVKEKSGNDKPSGTPTDPVAECEQHGQVCKMTSSQLGVCLAPKNGSEDPRCAGRSPCLVCAPQH